MNQEFKFITAQNSKNLFTLRVSVTSAFCNHPQAKRTLHKNT